MRYCISLPNWSKISTHAGVAELADAYASGAYEGSLVKVQVLSPAPRFTNKSPSCAITWQLYGFYDFVFFALYLCFTASICCLLQNRSNHFRH